ncbi:Oidioi.mRNA.OKI2018_I69.chr2.g8388.t1.cds [Oikopleura dioica]|uniref:Oidioi.mRNA.OKI2018_I69.chr2.g8388.t1.cds n=1 Tax=Oikopleura dioica TaxID=34765 RepID=A0ABN7T9K5_OIKDI|nr:Oidioi.mRNA.OKI2018_I69.chr2.g8388.t1.cds [Oikopleura dioica]
MFDSSNIVPIEGKEEELAQLIENDITSNLTNKLERFDTRWEPNYRGMPMEPQGIDENIEFFIPVLKELEQVLWKYGIKMSITRDEILYNKVTLYLLAPPISSKSRKVAIRTFRISKRSPHLDLLREIKKIGIPISQKWLPKMNELEHIDMEMANNYYTKERRIQIVD